MQREPCRLGLVHREAPGITLVTKQIRSRFNPLINPAMFNAGNGLELNAV
jgi:hypothetical protein|uniref:Uncharacterized protein n=1 Tax=Klebsiella pneumoniae TaxID=573 RepID=A0A6M6A344_KLEPN|nr:hypothetical protein [Klebsiella pneumoniae]QJX13121.1 hypothetical protein [Klebsiella pneumoniae]QJX13413.1 hypothetical protein [Klebsiella pneumoniae]